MIINFVGTFQNGYVGEVADETHIARELEALGHTVRRIPRDAWREYVIEDFPENKYDVPTELKADINLIAKWHHFTDERFIDALREKSGGPVFYWVWDYMYSGGIPDWHLRMARTADLYLTNEGGLFEEYKKEKVTPYYFPFDVADGDLPRYQIAEKKYEVTFFGSYLGQGERIKYMDYIKKYHNVKIFSWNYEDWKKQGYDAEPAVYGQEFNEKVAQSKIILGFSVEPNSWGYWSNRVGKVLTAGGFLLYQYAPGMELFLEDGAEYFSSPEEAVEKIDHYLLADSEREFTAQKGRILGDRFTSKARIRQLTILMDRYLKGDPKLWNSLP